MPAESVVAFSESVAPSTAVPDSVIVIPAMPVSTASAAPLSSKSRKSRPASDDELIVILLDAELLDGTTSRDEVATVAVFVKLCG